MSLKIAIVDDEQKEIDVLIGNAERYSQEKKIGIEYECFSDALAFVEGYDKSFDLILIDIDMPGLDGMSAIRRLREVDRSVMVIFVTNLAALAVKGYEVEAFDFVVKPVVYYNFSLKMDRVVKRWKSMRDREIWISNRSGRQMIKSNDIVYIEVMKHVVTFHTRQGDITTGNGTLKSIQEKLNDLPFALCNQCYLVNLRYVTAVGGDTVTVRGTELQMSSTKRKPFMNALNNYLASGRLAED